MPPFSPLRLGLSSYTSPGEGPLKGTHALSLPRRRRPSVLGVIPYTTGGRSRRERLGAGVRSRPMGLRRMVKGLSKSNEELEKERLSGRFGSLEYGQTTL